jgi:glycosyltransferase involved in cell wall biosynthesis
MSYLPLVSIGMPVYNGECYIHQAVTSLLVQSYSNFELIISDNASNDKTELICRNFESQDHRIRYIRHSENRGAAFNFNFVLNESVGEYFMWAAADDFWDINWIEALLPLAIESSCLAFGKIISVDESGTLIENPSSGRKFSFSGSLLNRRLKYYLELPAKGKANPIYGLINKKYISEMNVLILEEVAFGADMLFLFILLENVIIDSPDKNVKIYKRIHSKSSENSFEKNNIKNEKPKFINIFINLVKYISEPIKRYINYYKHLSKYEKIIYFFLTIPLCFKSAFFYLWINFKRKLQYI